MHAYVPKFLSIGLFCRPLAAKNTHFSSFWTSAFCGVASWRQGNVRKLNWGAQLQTFPCPTVSKLYSNAFMAKSGAQKLYEQTSRQTDTQAGWFLRPDCAPSSERPQFRMPPVLNAPELRSLHAAAPPVQPECPAERRAAAAVPLPESP